MSRPQKVRNVFAELKAVMGQTMSSSDLIECARLIVSCAEGNDVRKRYDLRVGATPFEELSLDTLYDRYSWKLMCQDYRSEDQYTPRQRPGELIEQLLMQAA